MNKQERIRGLIKGYLSPHLIYAHSQSINGVVDSLIELLNSEDLVIKGEEIPSEYWVWNTANYADVKPMPLEIKEFLKEFRKVESLIEEEK